MDKSKKDSNLTYKLFLGIIGLVLLCGLSFYGGISTQSVMPTGTPAQVQEATAACVRSLAPDGTGLILGPSHRMQSDIPVENVNAMLEVFPKSAQ